MAEAVLVGELREGWQRVLCQRLVGDYPKEIIDVMLLLWFWLLFYSGAMIFDVGTTELTYTGTAGIHRWHTPLASSDCVVVQLCGLCSLAEREGNVVWGWVLLSPLHL